MPLSCISVPVDQEERESEEKTGWMVSREQEGEGRQRQRGGKIARRRESNKVQRCNRETGWQLCYTLFLPSFPFHCHQITGTEMSPV